MDFVENIGLVKGYGFGCGLILNIISAGKTRNKTRQDGVSLSNFSN